MATIALNIPDDKITVVVNHAARALHYPAQVSSADGQSMIANPETKAQFVRRMLAAYLRSLVAQGARAVAVESAQSEADAGVAGITIS